MKLIDVHCHLTDEAFKRDRDQVVENAKKKGVICVIESVTKPSEYPLALEIASKHPGYVYISLGLQPDILDDEAFNQTLNLLEKEKDKIVAIGEVGLDYYKVREEGDRYVMQQRFRHFIRLARKLDKPIVVHSRSAGKYAIETLESENAQKVVMHAFDGRRKWVRKGLDLGYYFSIPPSVCHSRQKQKLADEVPLEMMLLESDAPVLSPFPDKRNEPAYIVYTVEKIAEIKREKPEEIAYQTTQNAIKLFKLPVDV